MVRAIARDVSLVSTMTASTALRAVPVPWSEGAPAVRGLVPALSWDLHKGQSGRVGVVGGSFEYTGAPYYAAASTLAVGADLCWVFCADAAAAPIKGYSPELIVAPSYASGTRVFLDTVGPWVTGRGGHGLVLGPGLGRDAGVLAAAADLFALDVPIVVDADGLWLVARRPGLVRGRKDTVLTPNAPEFERLRCAVAPESDAGDAAAALVAVARALGGVTVVKKGPVDLISDGTGDVLAVAGEPGCPRRCGGLGDVLSGTLCVLNARAAALPTAAALQVRGGAPAEGGARTAAGAPVWAAYAACVATRRAAAAAFARKRRAMTAPDVLDELGAAFEGMCPTEVEGDPAEF